MSTAINSKCRGNGTKAHKIELPTGELALVDRADALLVEEYKWRRGGTKNRYAVSLLNHGTNVETVYLHRLIMAPGPNDVIDHIDGDPLNCRRANLRFATPSQNAANLSITRNQTGYRGVARYPVKQKFQGRLECEGGVFRGPYRDTAEEAAKDFDALARGLFGEFATYNFPRQGERGVIAEPPQSGGRPL